MSRRIVARLLVNADDFGLCESVNDAIVRCLEAGRISSTSLLVNAPATAAALHYAAGHPEYSIGLHFNLTDFSALGPGSPLTVGRRFAGLRRLAWLQATRPSSFAR